MDALGNPSVVALLGFVAVLLTSAAKQPWWPPWGKQLVSVAVAAGVGVLAVFMRVAAGEAEWSIEVVLAHMGAVFMVAQVVYWFLMKGAPLSSGGSPVAKLDSWLTSLGSGARGESASHGEHVRGDQPGASPVPLSGGDPGV